MLAQILDGEGVYGSLIHFTFAAAFCIIAVISFIYLWRKGRLDMDEKPAQEMLDRD